jgi:hypothetical protein
MRPSYWSFLLAAHAPAGRRAHAREHDLKSSKFADDCNSAAIREITLRTARSHENTPTGAARVTT